MTLAAASLLVLLAAAGCDVAIPVDFGTGDVSSAKPVDRVHAQAQAALERWEEAVRRSGGASISFVGQLTSQIGTWEPAVGDNNKAALYAGLVTPVVALSEDPPPRGEVRWLDGETIGVDVLSAADALADLVSTATATCGDCRHLVITDANLATGLVETSKGPAEAPIWVFTIEGTAVRVTRVAVDDSVTVEPPPWNAEDPPVGISIEGAVGSADSRDLEVSFIGAVEGRNKPCGAAYTAEAVESEHAVVVIVYEDRNPAPGACDAVGRTRTASVSLGAVLGERAVLEVKQGLPVPLRAP